MQAVGLKVATIYSIVPVLIALPILLVHRNILPSLQHTPLFLSSLLLYLFSLRIVSCLLFTLYPTTDHLVQVIGSLIVLYSGKIPYMMSIACATQMLALLFLSLDTTDIVWPGLYFLFLIINSLCIFGVFLEKTYFKTRPTFDQKKIE